MTHQNAAPKIRQDEMFDAVSAMAAKVNGTAQVTDSNPDWVKDAREAAVRIAARSGQVCSDDIHTACPPPADLHPNAMGAVFNTKRLHLIGYKKSARKSGHSRRIGIYQLAE